MNFIVRIALMTLVVLGAAHLLPGVYVEDLVIAVIVAVVLALLNAILRPILVVLTIPLTILTLGLFLFVINAGMILLTDRLIEGFRVDGFWWALGFSVVLSLAMSVLEAMTRKPKK